MAFVYDAITPGIRNAPVEGLLADIEGSALESRVVALAGIVDQEGPVYALLNDAEYSAVVETTIRQFKKIK